MIKGIDISYWQDKIPSFEGDFIIIRAGYGETEDTRFKTHYTNAKKLGKRVGVYWFSYALTVEQAKAEARKCLEVIKGLDIQMGVWFDMESDDYKKNSGFKLDRTNITNMCNAFCEITEKAGYYSGIYANYDYLLNYIRCPKYDKWIAFWGTNNGKIPSGNESMLRNMGASMWQYTSKLNGQNLDGDILLHDDINMYNIQPGNKPTSDKTAIIDKYITKITDLLNEMKGELK